MFYNFWSLIHVFICVKPVNDFLTWKNDKNITVWSSVIFRETQTYTSLMFIQRNDCTVGLLLSECKKPEHQNSNAMYVSTCGLVFSVLHWQQQDHSFDSKTWWFIVFLNKIFHLTLFCGYVDVWYVGHHAHVQEMSIWWRERTTVQHKNLISINQSSYCP